MKTKKKSSETLSGVMAITALTRKPSPESTKIMKVLKGKSYQEAESILWEVREQIRGTAKI